MTQLRKPSTNHDVTIQTAIVTLVPRQQPTPLHLRSDRAKRLRNLQRRSCASILHHTIHQKLPTQSPEELQRCGSCKDANEGLRLQKTATGHQTGLGDVKNLAGR